MKRDLAKQLLSHLSEKPLPTQDHRVLVVEDSDDVRKFFADVLQNAGYLVTSAATASEARRCYHRQVVDFHAAVLDYYLPDETAARLVSDLVSRTPLCRSIILTGGGKGFAGETARAGAFLYLQKPCGVPQMLDAVRRTVEATFQWRDALNTPQKGSKIMKAPPFDIRTTLDRLCQIGRLTTMESLVCWRLLWGDSNRQIARLLQLAEGTVKYHVTQVLHKTNAPSRAGLLRAVLEDAGYRDPLGDYPRG